MGGKGAFLYDKIFWKMRCIYLLITLKHLCLLWEWHLTLTPCVWRDYCCMRSKAVIINALIEKALKRRKDKVLKGSQEDGRRGLVPARAVAWAGHSILENSQSICGGSHLFFQLLYVRTYLYSILELFRKNYVQNKKKTLSQPPLPMKTRTNKTNTHSHDEKKEGNCWGNGYLLLHRFSDQWQKEESQFLWPCYMPEGILLPSNPHNAAVRNILPTPAKKYCNSWYWLYIKT